MTLKSLGIKEGNSVWSMLLGSGLLAMLAFTVAQQLTRDGGLTQAGNPLDGAWMLVQCAAVSAGLAALLDWRLFLKSLVSLPVILLLALAALTLASGSWSIVLEAEAQRYGLLIFGYATVCLSAAVLASRFGPVPLIVLLVGISVASAAYGLWGFALERVPYAVESGGVLTPAGPFRYRNALALTSAVALLPLIRGISIQGRSLPEVVVFLLSSICLGVCSLAVALSDSEFNLIFAILVLAAALIWPAALLSRSRQQAIGAVVTVLLLGVAGNLLFRNFLPAGVPEDSTRLVVMVALVVVTPLIAWLSGLLAGWIPDRLARLVPAIALGAGLLGVVFLIAGGAYLGSGGDLTQSRLTYYEVSVEAAKQNPLKGTGSGSYASATIGFQAAKLSTTTRFAHSIPAEMWVELGIGGLLISVLLYLAAIRASWRAFRVPFAALLIPLVIGFLWNGLIDWNWHFAAITALWAIGLGGLVGARLGNISGGASPDEVSEPDTSVDPDPDQSEIPATG